MLLLLLIYYRSFIHSSTNIPPSVWWWYHLSPAAQSHSNSCVCNISTRFDSLYSKYNFTFSPPQQKNSETAHFLTFAPSPKLNVTISFVISFNHFILVYKCSSLLFTFNGQFGYNNNLLLTPNPSIINIVKSDISPWIMFFNKRKTFQDHPPLIDKISIFTYFWPFFLHMPIIEAFVETCARWCSSHESLSVSSSFSSGWL